MPTTKAILHKLQLLFSVFILILTATLVWPKVAYADNPGDLDVTFGNTGIVTTSIGSTSNEGQAVAIQPDGKIVVAGNSDDDFAVVRYESDGDLDTTFNNTGIVTTDINGSFDDLSSVALQPDGKIVVVGTGVVRYTITGTLDTSFNGTGIVTSSSGSGVTIPPNDNKIVVGGSSGTGFRAVRYNEDGSLDTTFNNTGIVTTSINGSFGVAGRSVASQADGKVLVVGENYTNASLSLSEITVIRYTITGTLDTTFNTTGIATVPLGSGENLGYAVDVQPQNNKIVVTGVDNTGSDPRVVVARFNSDGQLDASFNSTGIVTTSLENGGIGGIDVAVQSNEKIVVAGTAVDNSTNNYDFALLRYNSNGTLDTGLNSTGIITTPLSGNYDVGFSVALQADGKIVVAGLEGAIPTTSPSSNFAVVRYLGSERSYLPIILKN